MARTKKHPDFPGYLFYDDGRIQSVKARFYNRLWDQWRANPHFMKFIKFRKHPQYDWFFTNITDVEGNQKTIHPHIMTATLFVPKGKKNKDKYHVWPKDNNKHNIHYTNLMWVNQGDLNYIQQELGTRDMAAQAAIMRKKRKTVGRSQKKKANKK